MSLSNWQDRNDWAVRENGAVVVGWWWWKEKAREEGEENLPFEIITVNVYFMFHIYGNAVYLNYCTSVIMFKLFHALTLLKRVTETSENK